MARKPRDARTDPPKREPAELSVKECLLMTGCNSMLELCKMVMKKDEAGNYTMAEGKRIEVLKALLPYHYPALRSSEVTGTVDHTITVNIRQFGAPVEPKAIEAEVVKEITDGK